MGCTPEYFKRHTVVGEDVQLNQMLKICHLHMIAIGGSIGAGLFVGSGSVLSRSEGICKKFFGAYDYRDSLRISPLIYRKSITKPIRTLVYDIKGKI